MKFIDQIAEKFGYTKQKPVSKKRSYAGAKIDRLNFNWAHSILSADQEIFRSLPVLRARSRDLANNNGYFKKYLNLLKINVVGPTGMALQVAAKDENGRLDTKANQIIEDSFAIWSKKGSCDVTGVLSFAKLQELCIESVARDGEVLIRLVKNYGNAYRFAVQLIEADHLDINKNDDLGNGRFIRMGVEFDQWRKPIAYHIVTRHPGDLTHPNNNSKQTERVPATEMIHLFDPWRPNQTRGIPWAHAAMVRLNMLGGYEEAEVVAARLGACKMGFFTRSAEGAGYEGEDDGDGNLITEAEPGMFDQLPPGVGLEQFTPDHPNSNYGNFTKSCLRGIASSFGISYHSMASDLEGVNFSSIRSGTLEERDAYMTIQRWMAENLLNPIFEAWLEMAMLSQKVALPFSKFDKFNAPVWMGRRWSWVDPEKDMQANLLAVQMGVKSVEDVIRETGRDPDDVLNAFSKSKEKLLKLGLQDVLTFIFKGDKGNANGNDPKTQK
jgi:lambda family phage portal protein